MNMSMNELDLSMPGDLTLLGGPERSMSAMEITFESNQHTHVFCGRLIRFEIHLNDEERVE